MTIADDARERSETARYEQRIAELRRDRDGKAEALRRSTATVEDLTARLALIQQVSDLNPRPPRWLAPKKPRNGHHATITTSLSDTHFDEVVNPDELGGVNAYDRQIATLRLKRYFDRLVFVARDQMAGLTWDGVVLMLGGDLVSGDIHEELEQTNDATLPQTVLYWSEQIAAGIGMLADVFGHVHVPVVVGNHGRRQRKKKAKGRAVDSWDWLMAKMVERIFAGDDRVTFTIPDAYFVQFDVYDTTYRLEHGDQASGGSGWMGPLGPIMRRQQKVETVATATEQPFDHMVVGHFHTYVCLPRGTMNGSLKGYDEFAAQGAFGFERPQQAMWVTTPEQGVTWRAPIFCDDRKKEGW